ncbi:VacJ family lipoprotein [Aliidiomarina soli]|uniref:ABC transporter n=1 Tax=Aliidiomarina soli TaxID=1928574 RepID=A0A432WCZ1_9GAMM|nr:VacJ family lipoprotein [Aliidiomarina soli]RUO30270.1 hypothetical protein CWE14_12910 [Aliidiomarina soli]
MKHKTFWSFWLVPALVLTLSACSSTPAEDAADSAITADSAEEDTPQPEDAGEPEFDFSDDRDPWEEFNRRMWSFNRNILDPFFVTPAATGWSYIPKPVRSGLYNMTENLTEPASVVNNVLQGKGKSSAVSVGRFVLNSTIGLLGFFDVATPMGLVQDKESFGETLAVWGSPDGPYIMLPGIGPTVVVDRGGDFVDDLYSPTNYFNFYVSLARYAIRGLEQRLEVRELEPMLESSLDEYAFVRDVYFSYWRDKVYDGEPPREDRWDQDLDDWDNWDDYSWVEDSASDASWSDREDEQAWQTIKRAN